MPHKGRFHRGYKPDPQGHRHVSFELHPAHVKGAVTPSSADLSAFLPKVMDQGPIGACVGHAISGAAYTTLHREGLEVFDTSPEPASPAEIYRNARALDRVKNPDGTFPPLVDEGSEPNQAIRGIAEWGVIPMAPPTSDGRYSDAEVSTINAEPNFLTLQKESKELLVGAYRIDSFGDDRKNDVRQALASGFAVTIAVMVDTKFEDYVDGQAPLSSYNPMDILGGHYIFLHGYHEDGDGTIFHGRNSWGTIWGKAGNFEADEKFLQVASDLYVMAVTEKKS